MAVDVAARGPGLFVAVGWWVGWAGVAGGDEVWAAWSGADFPVGHLGVSGWGNTVSVRQIASWGLATGMGTCLGMVTWSLGPGVPLGFHALGLVHCMGVRVRGVRAV